MKRVLVISYYWPPAGSVSVLRTLKIVKYLRQYGWEPIVYVPANAHYDYIDHGGLKDIPSAIEILRGTILEPFSIFRLITGRQKNEPIDNLLSVQNKKPSIIEFFAIWIRANLFIPDARALWIRVSVLRLTKYLRKNPVHAILTDGPPHTNTIIGYHLSRKFSLPWLADFQDPWTQVDYLQDFPLTNWAKRRHEAMEQKVFTQASRITIASPTWKKDIEAIGAKNVDVVYYGYDEADFASIKRSKRNDQFSIFHGGLLGYDRFPKTFFESISSLVQMDKDFSEKLCLTLAGKVDYRIIEYLESVGLMKHTHLLGFISRQEVLQNEVNADLLLLPLNKAANSRGRLPGKLYEYLRSGTPILSLGLIDSDVSTILAQTSCGVCLSYEDQTGIKEFLHRVFHENEVLKMNHGKVKEYSNLKQTRRVAQHLDDIIAANNE